jgi:hypothetical protein
MSIIVSDSSPSSLMFILHTFLMHRVPQTVFQYNSQQSFGAQSSICAGRLSQDWQLQRKIIKTIEKYYILYSQ